MMQRPSPTRSGIAGPSLIALAGALVLVACGASTSPVPSGAPTSLPDVGGPASPGSFGTQESSPGGSPAAPFDPAAISVTLEQLERVDGGPLAFSAPDDGSARVFIGAKDGRIWILKDGSVSADPLLDLRGLVSTGGEQGLLGIAVHPGSATDPRVFVHYTDRQGNTVVASFHFSTSNSNRLDPASEQRIIALEQPYANHNGGAIAFGPDRLLYVSLGDGGSGGDPHGNGQRLDTLLGKVLRIDVDSTGGGAYSIPADNPFVGRAGALPEIWLTGLRNPWRMAFDRVTGDLWIGDVGQADWEEIDVAGAGVGGINFGWNVMEGARCFLPARDCSQVGLTLPVTKYGHDLGCTVIGGSVYRGTAQPLLVGGYLFADYCSGRLWAIPVTDHGPVNPVRVGTTGAGIVAFGESADGEPLVANLVGTISRIVVSLR